MESLIAVAGDPTVSPLPSRAEGDVISKSSRLVQFRQPSLLGEQLIWKGGWDLHPHIADLHSAPVTIPGTAFRDHVS